MRNLGLTADRFTLEVVGAAASWTTLDPAVLVLGPEQTGQVTLYFHPPRAAHIRAGSMPFGVLATSAQEGTSSVVEQLIEMRRFTDTGLELVPRTVRRASAVFELAVTNRGNDTLRVTLRGRDLAGVLRVDCTPTGLTVFPGTVAQSRIRIRSARRHWRGKALRQPFQVIVDPGADPPLIVSGELVLRPILPG